MDADRPESARHDVADPVVFAGVDWGGSFHQLCLIDAAGAVLVQQRIDHDVNGLALLAARLQAAGRVLAAIERAEGLLVEFLMTLPAVTVFCVSAEDLGQGAGAVSDVRGEVGQLRRLRAGRHAPPRTPAGGGRCGRCHR